jgi:hypothetical protein
MVDWTRLRPGQRLLVVEGDTDRKIIEAFLRAGEKLGHWRSWSAVLDIQDGGGFKGVLSELEKTTVWGLIDRDWKSDTEIHDLTNRYPNLLVLPRVTIENYCIDPVDLEKLLPPNRQNPAIKAGIEAVVESWIQHGALSKVLYENGAHYFCRGAAGYPNALIDMPVTDEARIRAILLDWHRQLDPEKTLAAYQKMRNVFQNFSSQAFSICIDGKKFFNEVVVQILNREFGQQESKAWISELFQLEN